MAQGTFRTHCDHHGQKTSNQNENQLTGIHVAEQSQTERDRFDSRLTPSRIKLTGMNAQ